MQRLGKSILLFDGGMGSELVKAGFANSCPEDLNVTNPDTIVEIHQNYSAADFITTNTFGLNRLKYRGQFDLATVARCAIENARKSGKYVFFDIGPTGKLLRPLGTLDFDTAYDTFREMVELSRDKVDGYILETFSDLYELKAALLAIKENSDKPVFATMTFDKNGRTLTGTTPEIMVAFLEKMGVNALGINCSLGPDELSDIVLRLITVSHTPILLQPNRGIPRLVNGESVYDLSAEEFAKKMKEYVQMGVSILGGCCGTNPDFIHSIAPLREQPVVKITLQNRDAIFSYAKLVYPDEETDIRSYTIDMDISPDECEDAAYEILDLIDDGAKVVEIVTNAIAPATLRSFLEAVQSLTSVPLTLVSDDEEIQKAFKRYYNG